MAFSESTQEIQMQRARDGFQPFSVWLLGFLTITRLIVGQQVTYAPYLQPGDNGPFGLTDSIVVAWQTNESTPSPKAYTVQYGATPSYGQTATVSARVVNNYLAADSSLPAVPAASGPRSNYTAVLKGLNYDTTYYYSVTGPGIASTASSFRSRTQSGQFSFLVEGDEGFFPAEPGSPPTTANFEGRIAHLMYNVKNISLSGQPSLPQASLALNTGDNVYNEGSEGSYRDYWFPVWNSDADSVNTGAPFVRSIPYYIVAGNHDIGGAGDRVNMLASAGAGKYTGSTEGGDALAYYNDYYFPLNGPAGFDPANVFNGDSFSQTGFLWQYNGKSYTSAAATAAFRNSTAVDTGKGITTQIDHMSNYSFDYGNAHFLFLNSNPHLFNAQVDYSAPYTAPPAGFTAYPSALRDWIANDLDSSSQPWKFVVYHHSAFSSGDATQRNYQMRAISKLLEDHGVNIVFNGHEHNYQRTYPVRSLPRVVEAPTTLAPRAVIADSTFDGITNTVPDGVLHIVEGAGGNRDFDGAKPTPRGQGAGLDQEDTATGSYDFGAGLVFPQGPSSWLDTHLTTTQMSPFFPNAGTGPKITMKFKAKIFSFADVVVNNNSLTLYQISEPLQSTSSATSSNPNPYGTDFFGKPINDPVPDTVLNATTGALVSGSQDGPSALLDKFTVTKPQVNLRAELSAATAVVQGGELDYTFSVSNLSPYPLNGVQAVITLPAGVDYIGDLSDATTLQGQNTVVVTLGRLAAGENRQITVPTVVQEDLPAGTQLTANALLRSGTALSVNANAQSTFVIHFSGQ
jgi:uncharacterized repeat protein (TIGR01451 family)